MIIECPGYPVHVSRSHGVAQVTGRCLVRSETPAPMADDVEEEIRCTGGVVEGSLMIRDSSVVPTLGTFRMSCSSLPQMPFLGGLCTQPNVNVPMAHELNRIIHLARGNPFFSNLHNRIFHSARSNPFFSNLHKEKL